MIENAILYDVVNGEVLSRNSVVSETSLPTNINPSYKYFIPYEQFVKPNYDPRYYNYVLIETPTNDNHPSYPIYKSWKIEHSLVKRPNSEIFLSIENARKLVNHKLVDPDLMVIVHAISIKQLNGIQITADENSLLTEYIRIGNKVLNNKNLELSKKALVMAGQEPDIDSGWESV